MDINRCLKALNDYNCHQNVVAHSKAVSKKAVEIANTYSEKADATVDIKQVQYGAVWCMILADPKPIPSSMLL